MQKSAKMGLIRYLENYGYFSDLIKREVKKATINWSKFLVKRNV